jgi:glycosyltransferase involved in cell wall biosynthesis
MNKNVCVGLCVYNNSAGLPAVLNNINKLTTVFEKVNIIACYDESYDNSLEILTEYQKNHAEIQLDIIENKYGNKSGRTSNIANARNSVLDKIRETYSDYTYFIMMDSNEYSCIGDLNTNVIEEILQREDEWDSVSFDREAGYYDTWALSYDPYIYSFFHFGNSSKVVSMMRTHFNTLMKNAKREDMNQFIPVYSAFNGFAIYKSSMFLNCSYSSVINLEYMPIDILEKEVELTDSKLMPIFSDDCEHRMFHMESIKKNGSKIMISLKSVFSKLAEPIPHLRGPA